MFKTNETAWLRIHKDDASLMQAIYQTASAYFEDDCADELTNEPVMAAILDKDALASQPTLFRFFNRMDEDTLAQSNLIQFYCGRGKMEGFIQEVKNGFDFASVSSTSKVVNANRLQIHALAYNLSNWFRRLVLAADIREQRINMQKYTTMNNSV